MNADLVRMIGNLSQSLIPVQALITGLGYLIGILFFITAIGKFRKIGDARASGGSHERMFVPVAYIFGGAILIFLPSSLPVLSSTLFGSSSILEYTTYNPYNVYSAMRVVVQTMGILWFLRGCVLLVHASEPSVKEGPKGLVFIFAGIMAMNFEASIGVINYILNHLMALSLTPSAN